MNSIIINFKSLFLLISLASNIALADNLPPTEDVALLKNKIAPFRVQIENGTSIARKLQPIMRGASKEITYDQCKNIQQKIESQYSLSPFYATYKNGATFSQFCDWNIQFPTDDSSRSGLKYYFETNSSKSQLGLDGAFIVRITKPSLYYTYEKNNIVYEFLLNSQYKIIERNTSTSDKDGKIIDWEVTAINSTGDGFYTTGNGNSPFSGTTQRALYSSADGILYGGWIKRPRRSDRGNEVIINKIFEVHKKDWNNSSIVLLARYYKYDPENWATTSNIYNWLFEVSLAETGSEVCADGNSHEPSNHVSYKPSNNQDQWSCSNAW